MVNEVLKSNLSLRETNELVSKSCDDLRKEVFDLQNENEELRRSFQVRIEKTVENDELQEPREAKRTSNKAQKGERKQHSQVNMTLFAE